jgi:hypothetical protein
MDNNVHLITDGTDEQPWRDRSSISITMNRNIFTDICQSSSFFIFLIVIAIIPESSFDTI